METTPIEEIIEIIGRAIDSVMEAIDIVAVGLVKAIVFAYITLSKRSKVIPHYRINRRNNIWKT